MASSNAICNDFQPVSKRDSSEIPQGGPKLTDSREPPRSYEAIGLITILELVLYKVLDHLTIAEKLQSSRACKEWRRLVLKSVQSAVKLDYKELSTRQRNYALMARSEIGVTAWVNKFASVFELCRGGQLLRLCESLRVLEIPNSLLEPNVIQQARCPLRKLAAGMRGVAISEVCLKFPHLQALKINLQDDPAVTEV